jgi:hypothetical protein
MKSVASAATSCEPATNFAFGDLVDPKGAETPTEDWPPNEAGLIQGVGFDMAGGNRVLFSLSRFNDPNSVFDFMSYMANNSDETNVWISTRGCNQTLRFLRPFEATHPEGRPRAKTSIPAPS